MPNGCIQSRGKEFDKNDFLVLKFQLNNFRVILQKDGTIWEKYSIESVNHEIVSIKPGRSFVRVLNAKFGQILLFELFTNRTFEFKIENGKNKSKFMP